MDKPQSETTERPVVSHEIEANSVVSRETAFGDRQTIRTE